MWKLLLLLTILLNILKIILSNSPEICAVHERYEKCPEKLCQPQTCEYVGIPKCSIRYGRSARIKENNITDVSKSGDECDGPASCLCVENYVRNYQGICVPIEECTNQKLTSTQHKSQEDNKSPGNTRYPIENKSYCQHCNGFCYEHGNCKNEKTAENQNEDNKSSCSTENSKGDNKQCGKKEGGCKESSEEEYSKEMCGCSDLSGEIKNSESHEHCNGKTTTSKVITTTSEENWTNDQWAHKTTGKHESSTKLSGTATTNSIQNSNNKPMATTPSLTEIESKATKGPTSTITELQSTTTVKSWLTTGSIAPEPPGSIKCDGRHEKYYECLPPCPDYTCSDHIERRTSPCIKKYDDSNCTPGCRCILGHYRDVDGQCVAGIKCRKSTKRS